MPITIYHTRSKQFRYKVTGKNNEILVHSESMTTKQSIKKSIRSLVREVLQEYEPTLVIDKTIKSGIDTYWV